MSFQGGYGTQGGYPQPGGTGYQAVQPASGTGYPPQQAPQPGAGYPPAAPPPQVGFAGTQPQPAGMVPQPAGMVPQPSGAGYPPSTGAGYPPVAHEGYQGRVDPSQPPQPPAGQVQQPMPPPAGKYVAQEQPAGAVSSGPDSIATAPPMDKMEEITGYSGNNFDAEFSAPPPSYAEATQPAERPQNQNFRIPVINEETARSALLAEVGSHCCWGKGPAEQLVFLDLKSFSAMHYTFETFTESRSTKWTHEPYNGQPIDSIAYGPAPLPWDVQVPPPTLFVNNTMKIEVPHTASVKPCHTCMGMGRKRCTSCRGNGWDRCSPCNGTGRSTHGAGSGAGDCNFCQGRGRKECMHCHGNGSKQCNTCRGKAQLKCYIKLTVKWTNHYEDHVLDGSQLPVEKLRQVNGDVAFQEEYPRVWALSTFPDDRLNRASKRLVDKHNQAYITDRILMQRHKVRVVPITEVVYKHKDHQGSYLVYGFENKAYVTDYPSTCCGCCVIL